MSLSRSRKLLGLLLLPFASSVVAACDSSEAGDAGSTDAIEAIPFRSTKMLSLADLASLDMDQGDGRLLFQRAPRVLDGVAAGAVIVAGVSKSTPHGFLRVVAEAKRTGEALELMTVAAPPELAFRKLHARVARPVTLDDGTFEAHPVLAPLGVGGTKGRTVPVNVVLFDGDGNDATTDDQLRVEGSFSGSVRYDLSLDLDWGAVDDLPEHVAKCAANLVKVVVGAKASCKIQDLLPEVKVTFTVDPKVASELRIVGRAAVDFDKPFDIATVHLVPIVLGPLVFVPTLDVIASVEGGASASFRAGVKGHVELTSSVTVSSRTAGNPVIAPVKVKDTGFDVEQPEIGLHAHATAKVGVRLGMPLYASAGPYATAEASLAIAADPTRSPCWELRSGLESTVGVRITSPNLPVLGHVTLVNWKAAPFKAIDQVVASGACTDPPAGVTHLPPGSGPDAATVRSPMFAPWSSVSEGGRDATATAGPGVTGIVFTDLVRTIDDRWLVAGSEARSLLKLDELGQPIWRTEYVTDTETALHILRTVPTRDASIAALASGDAGSSFDLLKLGQGGGLAFRRSFTLPLDRCATPSVRLLANDGPKGAGTGFVIAGECLAQAAAFVVHLDADGAVVAARMWSDPSATGISPTALTRAGASGEIVLVGEARGDAGDAMFVARLDDEGELRTASRYAACETSFNLSPTAVAAAAAGGVTIAGGSHGQTRAFVARIRDNGDVGFVSFPGLAGGSAPIFVASALAELPTSGFVMAASTVELTAEGAAAVPAIALVGLDPAGRPTWSKRYALSATRAASFGALRLTTDGGALVSAMTEGDAGEGSAWTMKVHARDGASGAAAVGASALALDGGPPCALARSAFAPIITELDVVAETRSARVVRR